jgi:hypothetical protein
MNDQHRVDGRPEIQPTAEELPEVVPKFSFDIRESRQSWLDPAVRFLERRTFVELGFVLSLASFTYLGYQATNDGGNATAMNLARDALILLPVLGLALVSLLLGRKHGTTCQINADQSPQPRNVGGDQKETGATP